MVRGKKLGNGPRGVQYSPIVIVEAVRRMYQERGEPVTYHRFAHYSGIPCWQIYQTFSSWYDVREAAGLPRKPPNSRNIPYDKLLFELHRAVRVLRRWPSPGEYERMVARNYHLLWRKIGPWEAVRARYREWLDEHPEHWKVGAAALNVQQVAASPTTVGWMRQAWQQARVGFELRSSDYHGRDVHACDFLVVLDHDWGQCPVPVVLLSDVLPHPDAPELERRTAR